MTTTAVTIHVLIEHLHQVYTTDTLESRWRYPNPCQQSSSCWIKHIPMQMLTLSLKTMCWLMNTYQWTLCGIYRNYTNWYTVKLLLYDTGWLSLTHNLVDNVLVKAFVMLHSPKFATANLVSHGIMQHLSQINLSLHRKWLRTQINARLWLPRQWVGEVSLYQHLHLSVVEHAPHLRHC